MADEQSLSELTKPRRIAGAFAIYAIYSYLDGIAIEAAGLAPEVLGGQAYCYFDQVYKNISDIYARDPDDKLRQQEACLLAVDAIRQFVNGYEESGDARLDAAYRRFSAKIYVIDRLLAGETIQEINAELAAYPHFWEGEVTQKPAPPSLPSPE